MKHIPNHKAPDGGASTTEYHANEERFRFELIALINKHSMENRSNTPDHILASVMMSALTSFEYAIRERDQWYGIDPVPGYSNKKLEV